MTVLSMQKEKFKKILGNFKNKNYDAQFDYWLNLANLIFVVGCAVVALIFYIFN